MGVAGVSFAGRLSDDEDDTHSVCSGYADVDAHVPFKRGTVHALSYKLLPALRGMSIASRIHSMTCCAVCCRDAPLRRSRRQVKDQGRIHDVRWI